jgi:hypothetical protein
VVRTLAATVCLLLAAPAAAGADWLITPFIAMGFAGQSNYVVMERGAGESKLTFGASVALMSDGLLGLEADVAHIPSFFNSDTPQGLIKSSRVTTLGGNLLVAAPLALTRESLRPYLVGGLGLMQARSDDVIGFFPPQHDVLGLTLGGGAIGMLTARTGVRFDLRHLKAVTGPDGPFPADGTARLGFWRASLGVIVRY